MDGADLIKLTATGGILSLAASGQNPQFTDEELKAIVETAKDYNMVVTVHAHGAEGMKRAVLAGVNSVEHGTYMTDEIMEVSRSCWCFRLAGEGQTPFRIALLRIAGLKRRRLPRRFEH